MTEYVRIQATAADSEARTWSNPLYIQPGDADGSCQPECVPEDAERANAG